MHVIVFVTLAIIGFVVHVAFVERPTQPARWLEVGLLYFFAVIVGGGGLFGFMGHTLVADDVAAQIGWPAGNPFQTEVAFTNLAFGVLGVLSVRLRGDFWLATSIGWGIFLMGAGVTHLVDLVAHGNDAPSNTGPVLYSDFIKPVILLTAVLAHRRLLGGRGSAEVAAVGAPLPRPS
jgi:hypothetical protein